MAPGADAFPGLALLPVVGGASRAGPVKARQATVPAAEPGAVWLRARGKAGKGREEVERRRSRAIPWRRDKIGKACGGVAFLQAVLPISLKSCAERALPLVAIPDKSRQDFARRHSPAGGPVPAESAHWRQK